MAAATETTTDEGIVEPQFTDHALDRYDQRAPADAIAPEAALVDAIPDTGIVEHPRFEAFVHPAPDRVWLYTSTHAGDLWTIVFIERNESVVTCWRADTERRPAIRAYLLVRSYGGLGR